MSARERDVELLSQAFGESVNGGQDSPTSTAVAFVKTIQTEPRDATVADDKIGHQSKTLFLPLAVACADDEASDELHLRAKQKSQVISAINRAARPPTEQTLLPEFWPAFVLHGAAMRLIR